MIDLYDYEDKTPHKELLEQWGPSYWKEFREMEANYTFAGWTLDLMQYQVYRMVNNLFIATCDEQTLQKYEKLFGITPQDNQSLDSRRLTVLLLYVGRQKTSFSSMRQYIKSTVGADSVLAWDPEHDYTLRVRILASDENSFSIAELHRAMAARVPAHILLMFSQNVIILISGTEMVIFRTRIREIINWWSGSKMLDGTYHMDGSISMDQVRGPDIRAIIRYWIINTPGNDFSFMSRHTIPGKEIAEFSTTIRELLSWWDGYKLDGKYQMDGTIEMDQAFGPIVTGTIRQLIENTSAESDFSIRVKTNFVLDGSAKMDGSMTMAAGREEL
jgi:hypothetical protein